MGNNLDEIVDDIRSKSDYDSIVLGVAADLYIHKNKLFVLEKKDYWGNNIKSTKISYQNVGGAVEEKETFMEALRREVKEELDAEINILDSEKSLLISSEGETKNIDFDCENSPIMISSEIHQGKPGRPDAEGKWHLIGVMFKAELITDFTPSSEISGTLELDKNMLESKKEFKYSSIKGKNGAEVLENYSIPENSVFYPKFSAKRQIEYLS